MKVSFYLIDILNQEGKKMKTIVRKGVFETNSNSTHTMIMCTGEEYQKFEDGEMLVDLMDEELFSYDDIVDLITDDYYKDIFSESGIDITDKRAVVKWAAANIDDLQDADDFYDDTYLETFSQSFTTESGEKVVAFGRYGYDD